MHLLRRVRYERSGFQAGEPVPCPLGSVETQAGDCRSGRESAVVLAGARLERFEHQQAVVERETVSAAPTVRAHTATALSHSGGPVTTVRSALRTPRGADLPSSPRLLSSLACGYRVGGVLGPDTLDCYCLELSSLSPDTSTAGLSGAVCWTVCRVACVRP